MTAVAPVLCALLAAAPATRAPATARRSAMDDLLARHLAASVLKQLTLEDLVGAEPTWNADLEQGTLRFGDGPPHPVQLLGTEAYGDRTWLWAWGNTQSHLSPAVTKASERLRAIGAERGVAELVTRKLSLDRADGHTLAAIATGLLDAGSYYRGPYGDEDAPRGAAFLLLTDFPRPEQVNATAVRILRAVETVVSGPHDLDHRTVLRGLSADLRLPIRETPGKVAITSRDGETVEFAIDRRGLISRMEAVVRP